MRIEINAGAINAFATVGGFQSDMSDFISNTEDMIASFKAVKSKTYSLPGGVGNLQGAINNIDARITAEQAKKEDAEAIEKKTNDLLDLAVMIDMQVSIDVNKNKEAFYQVHPWLRPPAPEKEKEWYEKAWDYVCGKGEEFVEGLKEAWDWVKDTASKAWEGLVEFYQEHKKIIDTILIVAGAVLAIAAVVASGGGALIPLLTALGCSAGTAAAISGAVAVVAVVSTTASSAMNVVDIWCEIDNPTFQSWKNGLTIVSAVSNLTYSVGTIYNSFHHITPEHAKMMMKDITSGSSSKVVNGKYVTCLSDYQPGADGAIDRNLLTKNSTDHFYTIDNPNGGKITVSVDPVTKNGVASINIDPSKEYIVISGTHGGMNGGLSFAGPPPGMQFYWEDVNTFKNLSNVQVVNIQNIVQGLDMSGMPTGYNMKAMSDIFKSGKDIICAWCYSDRTFVIKNFFGLF